MPVQWKFDRTVSIGNLLSIATVIGGLTAGYMSIASSVSASAEAVKIIPQLDKRLSSVEQTIEVGKLARLKLEARVDKQDEYNSRILQDLARIKEKLGISE